MAVTSENTLDASDAVDTKKLAALGKIRIVLVHTSHPGNIGAVARAMMNMGLAQLYLVSPKKFPHDEAVWRAASATRILDEAVVVETLEEAIADVRFVVGTSARERTIPWPLVNPRVFAEQAMVEAEHHEVALLFGREDRGLTNAELQMCNLHVHIPTNAEYTSLNIAMAVQLLCYELRMAAIGEAASQDYWAENDQEPATAEDIERFMVHLESTLYNLGFLKPAAPKRLMVRLRRLFHRSRMDEMEVNIMRGILTSAQKWVDKATKLEQDKP